VAGTLRWLVGAAVLVASSFRPAVASPPTNDDCLACHAADGLTRADGRPLGADLGSFASSVHGQAGLNCVDCHAALASVTEFPHAEKVPRPDCAACHDGPVAEYAASIHAEALRKNPGAPSAWCIDCHGRHDMRPAKDPQARTYPLNLPGTCGRCHGDPETIRKGGIRAGNVPALYQDSIHGRALARSGLVVAPNCSSCHGSHGIRPAADPKSRVFHANVPSVCGGCHQGILAEYKTSVHAEAAAGRHGAVCSDCHSAHGIQAVVPAWKLEVVGECGSCHAESIRTYRDGFHGKASARGYTRVATCADCHGAHGILRAEDARSPVSPAHRLETCRHCHGAVSARFASFDPHANPSDRRRGAAVHYTARAMKVLLVGVFAFFGLHTALWFPRSLLARRRRRRADEPPPPPREDGDAEPAH
jgi:nitrate/TMAO reductase-like tetraheme cytochrome c subunit